MLEKKPKKKTDTLIKKKGIDTKELFDTQLHPKQLQAYNSKKRFIFVSGSIQSGKTFCGALWFVKQIALYDKPGSTFIVAGVNFKLMAKSCTPRILYLLRGCGTFNKMYNTFQLNGGGVVYFASMTNDDAIEGATGVRAILVDEGFLLREKSWLNIVGRSSFLQCQIMVTSTPYTLNWSYNIYKDWKNGKRPDVDFIKINALENPYFPKEEFYKQKKLLDPRVFSRKYLANFEEMTGKVYEDFDEVENISEPFKLNRNWLVYAGVDFGYTNQFAISIRAISKDGKLDIQIGEIYKTRQDANQMTAILKKLKKQYNIQQFVCDSENPIMINTFINEGLPAIGCKKGPGSVVTGISFHNEIIRNKSHKIVKILCPNTMEEYGMYHYPDDTAKAKSENPVDIFNHLMDANRYVTMHIRDMKKQLQEKQKPILAKTHLQIANEEAMYEDEDNALDWY